MRFSEFASYLEHISTISSRNEIIKCLSEVFNNSNNDEIRHIIYLLSGRINPPYENTEFNIGRNTMIAAISQSLDMDKDKLTKEYVKIGDLGTTFAHFKTPFESTKNVNEVFDELVQLSKTVGKGSVQNKLTIISQQLVNMNPIEGKYFIKIVLNELRLGFSTRTVLDALSWQIDSTKNHRKAIERAYVVVSDLGYIAEYLKSNGLEKLSTMNIQLGIPLFAKLVAHVKDSSEIIERMTTPLVQPKYDGIRMQIHVFSKDNIRQVKLFSRNLEDMTDMFPEITKSYYDLSIENGIFDSEVIGYNEKEDKYLPFQQTVQRKRKYDILSFSTQFPMRSFVFDILYLNNRDLTIEPLSERLNLLKTIISDVSADDIIHPPETKQLSTKSEIDAYLNEKLKDGLEGLVAKDPNSIYEPGTRNYNWVKLKRSNLKNSLDDTLDLVILGYYWGYGNRAQNGIGGLLMGIYNKGTDEFETVAKVGSGVKENEWKEIKDYLNKIKLADKPSNVNVHKNLYPNVWVEPKVVCVVKADEITYSPIHTAGKTDKKLGLALRFPRLLIFNREDKNPEDTTSVKSMERMALFSGKVEKV